MLQINKLERIKKTFYLQNTEKVAKELLGKLFIRQIDGQVLSAEIVETEAYLSTGDLASHSARGKTNRNSSMFEEGGILYIYFIYGNHFCANIVTEEFGKGCAVLIRAGKPVSGIEMMKNNRGINNLHKLCAGPGNFAKSFMINKSSNLKKLYVGSEFGIFRYNDYSDNNIMVSERIGIKKSSDLLLRFYINNSEYLSRK